MSTPRAVLFDLDDTILSSDAVADLCWREACEMVSSHVPHIPASQLFEEIQKVRTWYWSDPVRHQRGRMNLFMARKEIADFAFARFAVPDSGLSEKMAELYHKRALEKLCPFPGAIETLKWFRSQSIPLGLITNGSSELQRWKIERFQLAPLFDLVVVEGEFGVGKPDPAVYMHALEKFPFRASDIWMVGDRLDWDIAAPQKLGMRGVWNDYKKQGLPKDSSVIPSRIIHSIAELMG